jgi:hypothetical protein
MPGVTEYLARALIEVHGENAVTFAEQALHNVRSRGRTRRVEEWQAVIAAIMTLQAMGKSSASD